MDYRTTFATEGTYTPDKLIAGNAHLLVGRKVTLLSGQNAVRGALLGKKITAATVAGAAAAGNTGNGTIGTLSAGTGVQLGVYKAVCVEPGSNVGTFAVFDPHGVRVGTAVVAVEFSGQVVFTIADGSTDFAAGDTFNVTVSAATEKYLLSLSAATDGSQVPDAILAEDMDASGGDKSVLVYTRGDFNTGGLTFGTGHTAATVTDGLRAKGITLLTNIAA
jgi:hypothetical protein